MAVKVQFEIGHTSRLRSKKLPHPQDFTHDWEIYVKGVNQADISNFVDKVVFHLLPSFPKPKRVVKEPPYAIQEYGYAGFLLPVEIFFRTRDEPKRIMYQYELLLPCLGPPQHYVEVKTHIFEAPSEGFRAKLMCGGGVPVFGPNIGASSISRTLSPSAGSVGEPAPNNKIGVVKAKGRAGTVSMNVDPGEDKMQKSRAVDPGKSNARVAPTMVTRSLARNATKQAAEGSRGKRTRRIAMDVTSTGNLTSPEKANTSGTRISRRRTRHAIRSVNVSKAQAARQPLEPLRRKPLVSPR
ncbi:protein AF-9-like [Drosophila kikkawai]|uniref:Protein AF-9-like n=1 Tax=Drosophila kikkawai TaxID=30033 RepID=A0ABM4GL80_DROKI|nr:protein AF-9-like [Drosophila kikkawai]